MAYVKGEIDYTGCATRDLLGLMQKHGCAELTKLERTAFCDVAQIPLRSYNRIIYQEMDFVGLDTADKICLALGIDVSMSLTIIPSGHIRSPEHMARDEFWVQGITPTTDQISIRAAALRELRESVLTIDFLPELVLPA